MLTAADLVHNVEVAKNQLRARGLLQRLVIGRIGRARTYDGYIGVRPSTHRAGDEPTYGPETRTAVETALVIVFGDVPADAGMRLRRADSDVEYAVVAVGGPTDATGRRVLSELTAVR